MMAAGSPSPARRRVGRRQQEEASVDICGRMHAAGWVANHDGNLTVRIDADRFLATPTGISKAAVSREQLIVVDGAGQRISGRGRPFSELSLHLCVYRQRPDAGAVLHAHPPTATGLAVAGVELLPTMMAEPVVSLGASVPLVPYARPKTPEFTANLLPHLEHSDALLLENHGALTLGPDLETAFLRMELLEHLAKVQLVAMQVGRLRQIPAADVEEMRIARERAGLGAAARQQQSRR